MFPKSRILGAELPLFIPPLDYYLRLASSDIFIVADSLKFSSRSAVQRRPLTIQEYEKWITVPVHFEEGDLINKVKIDYHENWQDKMIRSLQFAYHDLPYFEEFFPVVQKWLKSVYHSISRLNLGLIEWLSNIWAIDTEIVSLSHFFENTQPDLIVSLCRKIDADVYIVDHNNAAFVDRDRLVQQGINILDMGNYQSHLPEELAHKTNTSSLELLFEHGPQMQVVFENINNITQGYTKKI